MTHSALAHLALTVPLLFPGAPAELPVDDWLEAVEDLDSLVLDFQVTSSDGEQGHMHLAYDSAGRVHVVFDSSRRMEQWIDDEVMSVRASSDGESKHYDVQLDEIFTPASDWFDELKDRLPRKRESRSAQAGPQIDIWPDLEDDSVQFGCNYTGSPSSLFAWLPRLKVADFDVRELENGDWEVSEGDAFRMILEPEFGIPRKIFFGTGEEQREALTLEGLSLEAVPESEFLVTEPDGDSEDSSEEMTASVGRIAWASAKSNAYRWFWGRVDRDGIEFSDGDLEVVVTLFAEYYTAISTPFFEQRVAMEQKRIDDMIDRVLEHASDPTKRAGVEPMIQDLKAHGPEKYRQGLAKLTQAFLEQISPVPLEGVDGDHEEGILELERQGAERFVEEVFVEPVIEHLELRIEDLE